MMLRVNQIQTFSLHDGPGIRSTVFLQGCNLRCAWCHNPETWDVHPGLCYTKNQCISCGACVVVCSNHAHEINNNIHEYHPEKCKKCRRCLEVCSALALETNGNEIAIEDLVDQLLRDKKLYQYSGGGVTISGGEPFLQHHEVAELLKKLKEKKIHTAIESAINVPWAWICECLPWLDLMLADFKIYESAQHIKYTGTDNKLILNNLESLAKIIPMLVRIPVIGGVNDNIENMKQSAQFLASLNAKKLSVELLAYHDFGISKAEKIGIKQECFQSPDQEELSKFADVFRENGLTVQIN